MLTHMTAGKSAPAFAAIGTERVARAGRLHSEYAAGGSGNPDRAAAVGGMRHGQDAGGDRRARRRRTNRRRNARDSRDCGSDRTGADFGGRHQAEFGTGALAEDGDARLSKRWTSVPL